MTKRAGGGRDGKGLVAEVLMELTKSFVSFLQNVFFFFFFYTDLDLLQGFALNVHYERNGFSRRDHKLSLSFFSHFLAVFVIVFISHTQLVKGGEGGGGAEKREQILSLPTISEVTPQLPPTSPPLF